MIDLHDAVQDYLNVRRSLGYALARHGRLLPDFVDFVQVAGGEHVTAEAALAWATQPQGTHPAWWRQRLGIVRGFARFLETIDPATEVPSTDLLPVHRPRVTPYLYSDDDIAALLAAARALRPCFRAATYSTLVGLLIVTSLRVGEAVALDRHDVELDTGVVVVRHPKLDKTREVCLHDTTVAALDAYSQARDSLFPHPTTSSFLLSTTGTRPHRSTVGYTFRQIIADAGLEGRGKRCRPRAHDLRHSFAVRTLLGWYHDGLDVDARLPLLSTFMGHADPGATYWYLQAAPELLAIAGHRLELVLGDLP